MIQLYNQIKLELASLVSGERNFLANASNFTSLLWQSLPELNWVGFYMLDGSELLLGPFQGKPACIRILLGKGVCGSSAENRLPIIVPDIHEFPGHIACDSDSKSELVIPMIKQNTLFGVLDLDSPVINRFSITDQQHLEEMLDLLINASDMDSLKLYYNII